MHYCVWLTLTGLMVSYNISSWVLITSLSYYINGFSTVRENWASIKIFNDFDIHMKPWGSHILSIDWVTID